MLFKKNQFILFLLMILNSSITVYAADLVNTFKFSHTKSASVKKCSFNSLQEQLVDARQQVRELRMVIDQQKARISNSATVLRLYHQTVQDLRKQLNTETQISMQQREEIALLRQQLQLTKKVIQ